MIDRWFCDKNKDDYSSEYNPDQAVIDSRFYNPYGRELNVIFPPWHGGRPVVDLLAWRLSIRSAVLRYEFHDRILEPDMETVPMSFNNISRRVVSDLSTLESDQQYDRINLIGLSLGNVALAKTARNFDGFHSATLVAAGVSLADAVWEGTGASNVKHSFMEQGVDQKQLRAAWFDLAPANHAKAFKDKYVKTVVSRTDTVIPAHSQLQMSERLRQEEAIVEERATRFGHVATLTSFCIKG